MKISYMYKTLISGVIIVFHTEPWHYAQLHKYIYSFPSRMIFDSKLLRVSVMYVYYVYVCNWS